MRRIGLEPETRKYTPHVTLARLRGVRQASVASYLSERGALFAEPFTAERFVLYSARERIGRRTLCRRGRLPAGLRRSALVTKDRRYNWKKMFI